MSNISTRILYA